MLQPRVTIHHPLLGDTPTMSYRVATTTATTTWPESSILGWQWFLSFVKCSCIKTSKLWEKKPEKNPLGKFLIPPSLICISLASPVNDRDSESQKLTILQAIIHLIKSSILSVMIARPFSTELSLSLRCLVLSPKSTSKLSTLAYKKKKKMHYSQ